MDIVLALLAAMLFAFGTVLQQKAGLEAPQEGGSAGLLLRMVRRPVWLAGIVDIGGAVLVVVALIAFLTIADPSGGRADAPLRDWLVAGAVCAAVCAPLVMLARRGPAPRRAALLGIATGILFGLSAALTKAVVDELDDGVLTVLTTWHLYALAVVGYVSMTLNQLALNAGALAPAVATSMAFDPISSVVLGVTLLEESLHTSALGIAATLLALAAALAGMAILARSQSQAEVQSSP